MPRYVACCWVGAFAFLSFVPTYYLPQFGVFELGSVKISVSKYSVLLLSGLIAIVTCLRAGSGRILNRLRATPALLLTLVMLYVATGAASLAGARHPSFGLAKWIYFESTGAALFLAASLLEERTARAVARSLVLVGGLVAAYGILEYLLGYNPVFSSYFKQYNPYYYPGHRASSSIGNPIPLGCYLAALVPLAWWAASGSRLCSPYRLCAFALMGGILVTFSAGSWLAVGTALWMWWGGSIHLLPGKIKGAWTAGITVALCIVLLWSALARFGGSEFESLPDHVASTVSEGVRFLETERFRLSQYESAWNLLQEHPMLGVGYGHFTRLYDEYRSGHGGGSTSRTTENMYLMVATERGLLGLLVFLGLCGLMWKLLLEGTRARHGDCDAKLRLALLAAYTGFLVNMLFWDALNFPLTRVQFWLLLGLGLATLPKPGMRPA